MTNKIIVLAAAACGIGVAASASAMPLNPLRSDNSVDQVRQVRMVCDEYGRCWRETNPGEDIARGVIRGYSRLGGAQHLSASRLGSLSPVASRLGL
jgi:hypothetical protein